MASGGLMDRYAVLGNPVKHSLSPRIHSLFAEQTGQPISYIALEAPLDEFTSFVTDLHHDGYQGMNVTLPFKEEAWRVSETLSKRAEVAGAVNTLIRTETGWRGENTDGAGLLNDLTQNLHIELSGKRILILGAGGAVRGVLLPLLKASPALLHIANRTVKRAETLAADFAKYGNISGSGLDISFAEPFDIIINGTAASIKGEVPAIDEALLKTGGVCYDMMYSAIDTAFVVWGKNQQAAVSVDGLGMLVEQAAESFFLWRHVRPETTTVMRDLRPD